MAERFPITRPGLEALQDELKQLKTVERPAVVEAIKVARDHGDLSENAEYDAAKDRQGHIEARIAYLEDRTSRAEVVDTSQIGIDRVRFGTTVVLEDLDSGDELEYSLVGEDEADLEQQKLSIASPVGRALSGKQEDDEVVVQVPSGKRRYEVREIKAME